MEAAQQQGRHGQLKAGKRGTRLGLLLARYCVAADGARKPSGPVPSARLAVRECSRGGAPFAIQKYCGRRRKTRIQRHKKHANASARARHIRIQLLCGSRAVIGRSGSGEGGPGHPVESEIAAYQGEEEGGGERTPPTHKWKPTFPSGPFPISSFSSALDVHAPTSKEKRTKKRKQIIRQFDSNTTQ